MTIKIAGNLNTVSTNGSHCMQTSDAFSALTGLAIMGARDVVQYTPNDSMSLNGMQSQNLEMESFIESSRQQGIGNDESSWFLSQIQFIKNDQLYPTVEDKEQALLRCVQIRMQECSYAHDHLSTNGPNAQEAFLGEHWSRFSDITHDQGQHIDCDDFAEFSRHLLQKGSDELALGGHANRIGIDADGDGILDHMVTLWEPASGRQYISDGTFYASNSGDPSEVLTPEIYESMNRFGPNNSILGRDGNGGFLTFDYYASNFEDPGADLADESVQDGG
eukprot:COSAG01_NODE_5038_length_4532_cov_1.902323_2_plen_277_part_00